MSRIGFVLLTHAKPHQTLRLAWRLSSMFDDPPIVIHHDFGKCPLVETDFPANVSFVHPHFSTGWAEFSVVEATVMAISQLYQTADAPEWCAVMSGACYPIKPALQILNNLSSSGFNAYIQGQIVLPNDPQTRLGYERYCVKRFTFPSIDKHFRSRTRTVSLPTMLGNLLLPFRPDFRCYWGSQWFTVSRQAAEYVINFSRTPQSAALTKHYMPILFAEESYFQTALYNAPHLAVSTNNWLYLDWSGNKPNPKQLTLADLSALEASSAHFARKIDMDTDADLLDALDKIIDGKAAKITEVSKESSSL